MLSAIATETDSTVKAAITSIFLDIGYLQLVNYLTQNCSDNSPIHFEQFPT